MKKLFFLLLIVLVQLGYAQREANIWHFGAGVGLDFNSCEPVSVFSEMRSTEGCASIANGLGELQPSNLISIELSVHPKVPEWCGKKLRVPLEDDALITDRRLA